MIIYWHHIMSILEYWFSYSTQYLSSFSFTLRRKKKKSRPLWHKEVLKSNLVREFNAKKRPLNLRVHSQKFLQTTKSKKGSPKSCFKTISCSTLVSKRIWWTPISNFGPAKTYTRTRNPLEASFSMSLFLSQKKSLKFLTCFYTSLTKHIREV